RKRWKGYLFMPVMMIAVLTAIVLSPSIRLASGSSFIAGLNKVSMIASTVPANGDQNPYGMAVVPRSVGNLVQGNILISNFNNNGSNGGLQGTGTTIVQISPIGKMSTFAQIDAK